MIKFMTFLRPFTTNFHPHLQPFFNDFKFKINKWVADPVIFNGGPTGIEHLGIIACAWNTVHKICDLTCWIYAFLGPRALNRPKFKNLSPPSVLKLWKSFFMGIYPHLWVTNCWEWNFDLRPQKGAGPKKNGKTVKSISSFSFQFMFMVFGESVLQPRANIL